MCQSSKRLPAPQQRLCGGSLSAAPGQSQTPPQRDFCPASSFAAADRWARETLWKDMSKTEIRNRLQNMQKHNLVLTWWLTIITDCNCSYCVTCYQPRQTLQLSEFRFCFFLWLWLCIVCLDKHSLKLGWVTAFTDNLTISQRMSHFSVRSTLTGVI